jgi:hypothetical protein
VYDEDYTNHFALQLVSEHFLCTKVVELGSVNPYLGNIRGFHLVFYEIGPLTGSSTTPIWKTGEVFHSGGRKRSPPMPDNLPGRESLRRSAFSVRNYFSSLNMKTYLNQVYVCPSRQDHFDMFSPLYTVLLLAPSRSFLPLFKEYRAFSLYDFIRHDTRIEAELFCVTQGLAGVADRWSALDDYFDRLLVDDFMEPTKYSKLLFDDENFTRSRKYFWAIGCLNEFDVSIADNIKQWDLYYEGRIKPALDKLNLAELFDAARLTKPKSGDAYNEKRVQEFENLAKQARRHRDILENLRTQFKNKLETVKTLRDGVSLLTFPTL